MSNIGVRDLISKNVNEIDEFTKMFIRSSLNIREGIVQSNNPDISLLSLIRDTYISNLLFRYVGMMTLINSDILWTKIDNRITEYIQDFYAYDKFKQKLIYLHEYYTQIYNDTNENYDYCKFLEKMISKCDSNSESIKTKKYIRMIENRIFNLLNIDPIVNIPITYFKNNQKTNLKNNQKINVNLSQNNYHELLDSLDSMDLRHTIEKQYSSRTQNTIQDLSSLIISRKIIAQDNGYNSYYKYVNRGKFDNSETIKDLIIALNQKIDQKFINEIEKIYQYFSRTYNKNDKISTSDIIKYIRLHKNKSKFNPKIVINVIFSLIDRYFGIIMQKTDDIAWRPNVIVYKLYDKNTKIEYGKLYMDTAIYPEKKISGPIAIKLSDKMEINKNSSSTPEVSLIASYADNQCITYDNIISLFREFGYVLQNLCYESRVGMINYDEEFSNYLPLIMEYIAWDKNTIKMIVMNSSTSTNNQNIIDHIEMSRYIDMYYTLKIKCINAKFDHLLHNSEAFINVLLTNIKKPEKNDILNLYRKIYDEFLCTASDRLISNISYIDPLILVQEINGSQGVLYANLMNEIFAYASYYIIKNQPNNDFKKSVLFNSIDNYRIIVSNFLNTMNINCYQLYIKDVLKIDDPDEYITEDTNKFDDHDYDSDTDVDGII